MKRINVFDWMELTRPNQEGFTAEQKEKMKSIRNQVFCLAGVHPQSLVVAKSRGSIGEALYTAVFDATQHLKEQYRVNVPFSEYSNAG